ncbi:DUF222 domain-containing protein, partial [Mycobacterium sp. M1]
HLVDTLNPDGDYSDKERQAQRGLRIGRQRADGMSTLSGYITPELRATLEPVLAKLAAPGMANSADEHPCVSGTPTQQQITDDDRTVAQRNHDALLAAVRAVLASGELGQLNGLPVTVIVSTTLAELQAAAHPDTTPPPADTSMTGKAHTGGGSLLPMGDLLRMAAHAYHYLTIFDGRGRALWLGRSKRIASADQRIVLHARDRGCTRPGCPVSGYLSQAHHSDKDWAAGGRTDIDGLALACPPDNNTATVQGWTTRLGDTGRVEWIPPPHLERGQPRINPFHFIEAVIAHHRQKATEVPDPGPPPADPQHLPPGPYDTWPDDTWPDDPLPGDPGYDAALDDLQRSYDALDLDELARQHGFVDDGSILSR